jgi:uncharacterized protein
MIPFIIFTIIVFLFDLYAFKGLRSVSRNIQSIRFKTLLYFLFWLIPLILVLLTLLTYIKTQVSAPRYFNSYYFIVGLFMLFYVPKIVFVTGHFIDDIILSVRWIVNKLSKAGKNQFSGKKWYLSKTGMIIAIIPFISIFYGITVGRFNFRVIEQQIELNKLPPAFDGFKIIQISDIHIGSLYGQTKQVQKAIQLINSVDADLVLFTGDLVNNFSGELNGWDTIFSQIRSRYGKFAVLGNHDYGDYSSWKTPESKLENFEQIKQFFSKIDFLLLNNSNEILVKESDTIAIIGVENWGRPPFSQYGDLQKAISGVPGGLFKILLSHDPSHWDAEIKDLTDIALTLSGHTHGMQFGIEIGSFSWSPAKYVYPRWAGLYHSSNQYLYVNRGFGFIGFPGRVGMPPEITLITLIKAN